MDDPQKSHLTSNIRTGIVESLDQEISQFGIKSLLIEPGMVRTNLLSANNLQTAQSSVPEYAELAKNISEGLKSANQQQPGDPAKLGEIIVDLVRGEGCATGKEVPLRLPLGPDALETLKHKAEKTLELVGEWEDVIKSTNLD
jgi:hypothetical protein